MSLQSVRQIFLPNTPPDIEIIELKSEYRHRRTCRCRTQR